MDLDDAKAYCASKGGKLPLVKGQKRVSTRFGVSDGTPVDGFGLARAKWPSDLPGDEYWTGTEGSNPMRMFKVSYSPPGVIGVISVSRAGTYRVVCVP